MKRFTSVLVLLLMAATPMMAERVTPETARKVAETFLNNNGAKSSQLTDLSKEAGFSNLYIFNAEQGFVIIAADDCVKPILGYSLTGNFVVENMPENVHGWLQGYSDEIQYAIDSKAKATSETAKRWKDLMDGNTKAGRATTIVEPLVQTTWNQSAPYNNLCPKIGNTSTVTGCVATAMAQVMKFWNHPIVGTGSNSYSWNSQTLSADFGQTTYDWGNMTNTYGSSSTQTQKDAVATLMYHCGVSVNMNYNISGNGGSSASTYNVMNALQTYFSYAPFMQYKSKDDYGDELWIDMLKKELNDGRPLQYRGSDAGGNGGHSFVCDGYDSDDNFHFNWGWGSYCDGYYSVNDMKPGVGGIGAGNGVYTVGQSAIFGIEPISSLDAPTLSASVSEGYINLTWNAIDDAVSYDLYKNDVKIGTGITETNYSDSEVIVGSYYSYYVRAVSNENKSNPSNTVTELYYYRSLVPTNLSATYTNSNSILSWTGYEGNLSLELHYATKPDYRGWNADKDNHSTFWGERYPAASIAHLAGMEISKISCYLYYASSYTLYAFNGEVAETDKLCERSYSKANEGMEWIDFNFDTPLQIDCSKDLWVVLYNNDSYALYPALSGYYSGDNDSEGKYLASTLENLPTNKCGAQNISWLFITTLTDGTYTYNLFDNGVSVANDITATNYSVANPATNSIHQYTVKTNYYGGESAVSNMAGLALGTTTINHDFSLNANDKMTVTENSTLTVSGTLSNSNPEHLILEDGAQLINDSEDVKATVKKTITPPSTDDYGWYFIASPVTETVTPTAENGFLNGAYDLYYYNEPTYYWMNYEYSPFDINHQKGYLYANETTDGTTLQFAGTLTPSNSPVTINGLSHIASSLNGFNLVGNPFACNATVNKDFYVVDNTTGKVILASNGSEIAPCAGIFVKATANDASVTFTKAASRVEPSSSSFDIVVKREAQPTRDGVSAGSTTLDRARVRLGDAETLEKFSIGDGEGSVIYFPQNGQDLAVACANGENEMPLNFKAAKNGTYTLAFEVENLDLDYLHLIDNMTGNEVDVMAMPTYTFEAKTTDYASRFKLVFAEPTDGPSADEQPFAYYANGEIRLVETCHGASLQVVDMMGRVVVAGDAMNRVSTNGMTAGVYVLRLINGNDVKTQKIVIE